MGETESGQGTRMVGMSHPDKDRDPCLWSPLGLGLPFWEVGTDPPGHGQAAGREGGGGYGGPGACSRPAS